MNERKRKETADALLKSMEAIAARIRALIVAMPPYELLGYIYSRYMLKAMAEQDLTEDHGAANDAHDLINDNQFLLEYVHAVLASDAAVPEEVFNEAHCAELYQLCRRLRGEANIFAMATSVDTKDGAFGPDTAEVEFRAKTAWVMLRGNRHQVLEGEFYHYVLAPHDDMLKEVYGAGADGIAEGFQAMADAMRSGQAHAVIEMMKQLEAANAFAAERNKPLKDSMAAWVKANREQSEAAGLALDDLFRGGISNMSRHTKLPPMLLADLAYQRGEETDFFAEGDFAGTPYRTLPARKKPLIQLGADCYAIDPCFIRDAGYRALLHNLLQRRPDYKRSFEYRQKMLSEAAFADILSDQLPGAKVLQEVYYKDPLTKQWAENDTLVLIDDVLFLVEAKAGAAASIASPALDFGRHAQSVKDLVLKAYKQCERFFNYLASADEVPLFQLVDGKHEEFARIRRAEYRVMVPIGLTVESFSPFSAYCKELPEIEPLLGKHPFVSLAIDDLFVLKRFLPSPGAFAHYMEVRQAVAGIQRAHIFDEFDHLGAYLTKNRFDQDIASQLRDGNVDMLVWDGMSDIVDRSFEHEDWEFRSLPTQHFPPEVLSLLAALDAARVTGWLYADSRIRDLGGEGRDDLAKMLSDLRQTLDRHPARYFFLSGENGPLFIWIQRDGAEMDQAMRDNKASAAALAVNASHVVGIVAEVRLDGTYHQAWPFAVHIPTARTDENAHIYDDAERMLQRARRPSAV